MAFWEGKRVLVTGGAGFLGRFLVNELLQHGAEKKFILVPEKKDTDLRKWESCRKVVKDVDILIHLAVTGGGIGFNRENPGAIFYDNAIMGIQLMEAARQADVDKFVMAGTICSYPKFAPIPFMEEDLWKGYPEETNAPYGLSKKMHLVQSQAYRAQYGFHGIHLLLVNMYGPGDNFDPKSSHVIPALIRKFADAKYKGEKKVVVWGSGKASREFLYVADAARGIRLASERFDGPEPVNLGAGFEITISDLVNLVAKLMDYRDEIEWDRSKPDGQPRRMLDVSKSERLFGFKAETTFEEGLRKTIDWFLQNKNKLT